MTAGGGFSAGEDLSDLGAVAERVMRGCGLNPVRPRRGFDCQCGVPLYLWGRTLSTLLTLRLPLCVVRETDESIGAVHTRRVAEYWEPIPPRFQRPANLFFPQQPETF